MKGAWQHPLFCFERHVRRERALDWVWARFTFAFGGIADMAGPAAGAPVQRLTQLGHRVRSIYAIPPSLPGHKVLGCTHSTRRGAHATKRTHRVLRTCGGCVEACQKA